MPRSDYISDNLVNIRDRLKQNYAKTAEAATEKPEAVSDTPPVPAPAPLSTRTPAFPHAGRNEELERARRDLEGRLLRDIAATTAELEQERIRRQELEKFLAVLNRNHTEFQQLGNSGDPDFARKLERLRGEYFQAAGRVSAFELRRNSGGGISPADADPKRFGRLMFEALPLMIALIAGALIVAAALLIIFL
ncbi:hypothetical protein [Victivallis vadensis]|uniref:Uncharacterized protein n=1 Tax=Victivallis vadensis TaxID=172901 RepID=A0A2U1ADG3_9BACT|nr:hypothetical protein [Victivallis vadensis]PVY34454.1 hypothetical protein C8D82_14917 [Victivallis vadensis]